MAGSSDLYYVNWYKAKYMHEHNKIQNEIGGTHSVLWIELKKLQINIAS